MEKNTAEKKESNLSLAITNFITNQKKVFLFTGLALIIFIVIFMTYSIVFENVSKKAIFFLEETESDISELVSSTNLNTETIDKTIEDLQKYTKLGNSSYVKARASLLIAELYYTQKDWVKAQGFYSEAARYAPKAYTAGMALFNAGVCADEAGNAEEAISLFNKALLTKDFAQESRTLFNIARIEEQRGEIEKALVQYDSLIAKNPDNEWALLAKSRRIALSN